jgi:hypothetical protein
MNAMATSLEERVEYLERELRELRARRSIVEAPFLVTDEDGRVLLRVDVGADGRAVLAVMNPGQVPVVRLSSRLGAGSVQVLTDTGGPAVTLEGEGSCGNTTVFTRDGRPGGALFASRNAGGTLLLMNPAGKPVVGAGAMPNGAGSLIVSGAEGAAVHPGVRISIDPERQSGQIEATDREGRPARRRR